MDDSGVGVAVQDGSSELGSKYRNNSRKGPPLRSVEWCENHSANLVVWPHEDPDSRMSVPFKCRSWRHTGACQRWKGSQDFVRCRDAILSRGPHWVYVVLTFNQRNFKNPFQAYTAGGRQWQKVGQRLVYSYGAIDYLQTWEAHKSGFPHVNVAIHNETIWQLCEGDGWRSWRQELKRVVVSCGFGYVLHVEPLRSGMALDLAGYLTKLSRELTGAGIKSQVPVNAPAHFRRIRASRGLLAKPYKKAGWTGFLSHP